MRKNFMIGVIAILLSLSILGCEGLRGASVGNYDYNFIQHAHVSAKMQDARDNYYVVVNTDIQTNSGTPTKGTESFYGFKALVSKETYDALEVGDFVDLTKVEVKQASKPSDK